jgi:hypothetical protein
MMSCILLVVACRKSTNANWDVDAVIPVVNSWMSVRNFVNDSLFQSDQSGLMKVRLNREVAAIKLDSLISVPDTSFSIPFTNTFVIPLTFTVGQAITAFPPAELNFNISGGVKLKRIDVRKGMMTVNFSNHLTEPVDLVYKIISATRGSEVLTVSETVPPGNNALVRHYDLSGYSLNMRGLSGQGYNTVVQTYTFGLSTTASNSLTVNYGDGANIEVSYSGLVPDYVEGYFGQQTIDIPRDTVSLGLSDNFRADNFMLSDATMDFTILNEFGAEFSGQLADNASINSPGGTVVQLQTSQLSNININRASRSGTTVSPSTKQISFNASNSNITAFISNLPDKLAYQGRVIINPLGNISGYNDFAYYNSGIRILANIDIPLKFTAGYFELRSDTDVDFSDIGQLDRVNSGSFMITATNGFPFSVRLQGYMYDAANTLLDSLFVPGANVIEHGTLNGANEVLSPVQKKITVPVNKTKIGHLKSCKKIRIVSRFIMPPNPPEIKILEHYEVKVNIVAQMNYNVSLGD